MVPRETAYRIIGTLAIYTVYISIIHSYPRMVQSTILDDLYGISSGAIGLWFSSYVAFTMSRWYDLSVATGTVSGCLTDIAMVMRGYLVQIDAKNIPRKEMTELIERLKIAHAYHICEVFGSDRTRASKFVSEMFPDTKMKHSGGLVPMLASILGLITLVSEKLKFSDSVKFSLLPAVQQNASTIRSRAGECAMILSCRYPSIFTKCMYSFLVLHLAYLPVYLGCKTSWAWTPLVPLISLLGGAIIVSLAIIVETHFRNPFKTNDFKLDHIVAYTFSAIDDVLDI